MNVPSQVSFVYFHSFETIYRINAVNISEIRTRIVGVEGENADQLTTTTALIDHRCFPRKLRD